MRYTRCEACGAKALLAASQCPKCGHLLGLRTTTGVPVRLSHCRTCDTYYPSSRGECRWCGTATEPRSRIAPYVWVAIGVIVVAGGSLGARLLWKGRGVNLTAVPGAPTAEPTANQIADSNPGGLLDSSAAAADSAAAPAAASRPDTTTRATPGIADTALQGPAAAGSTAADVRWVTATAITWANVRSEPNRQSGIVAVISPDTRVRLGDRKDGWHRVKAGGIEGWVDPRLFAMDEQKGAR